MKKLFVQASDSLGKLFFVLLGGGFGMAFGILPMAILLTVLPSDVTEQSKMCATLYAGGLGGFGIGWAMSKIDKKPSRTVQIERA